jgi:hypothetical protein
MTPLGDVLFPPRLSTRQHPKRLGRKPAPTGLANPHGRSLSPECGPAVFSLVVDVYDWLYRAPGRQLPARHGAVRARRRRAIRAFAPE